MLLTTSLPSVSESCHAGTTHTYARRDVCLDCHTRLTQIEEDERRRGWWRTVWIWAFTGNIALTAFIPVGLFPLYAAIGARVWWKWQAKRRQQVAIC
jgi:hypothetical protein